MISVEKELFVFRGKYTIEGKLDLIIEEDEKLKIIDFKTGTDSIDDEKLENYISQIKLYCYLLSLNSEKKVIGGEIYFIKNQKLIQIPYENGDEENILLDFDIITEKIEKDDFLEKSTNKEKCLKCEFKKHCFGINMI